MATVTEGRLCTGVPYLMLGQGPPLLIASGLTSEHANPQGRWRQRTLAWAAPFAEHFTVYVVNRRPGLPPGTTMGDLAADYAEAVERDIGRPVSVHGTSTGGSVALQLAVDRPELVERMVVSAAACRLSDRGRRLQREILRLTETGEHRAVSALLLENMSRRPLKRPARALGWLAGGMFAVDDPSDMLRTLVAEDAVDLESALGRVTAPVLVLGGDADAFYSEDLFARTAAGIPRGHLVLYRGKGHMYVAGSKVPAAVGLGFLLAD